MQREDIKPLPQASVRFAAQAPAGEGGRVVGHVAANGTRHSRSWRFLRFPFLAQGKPYGPLSGAAFVRNGDRPP